MSETLNDSYDPDKKTSCFEIESVLLFPQFRIATVVVSCPRTNGCRLQSPERDIK